MQLNQFLRDNGLLLALLAASAGGHWALTLIESEPVYEYQPYDREYGRTSIAVQLVAARPKTEAAEEVLREQVKDPVETTPLEAAKVDPSDLPIRRREVTDPILTRQTAKPDRPIPLETAAAAPPRQDPTKAVEPTDEPIRRPKLAKQTNEQPTEVDVQVDVTIVSVELTGVDIPPKALTRIQPRYPADLLLRRIQGSLQLSVLIDASGKPTNVRVHQSSGYPAMDESALHAVRRWPFSPAMRGGTAVPHEVIVPINFKIE